jgi:hypothetical protein
MKRILLCLAVVCLLVGTVEAGHEGESRNGQHHDQCLEGLVPVCHVSFIGENADHTAWFSFPNTIWVGDDLSNFYLSEGNWPDSCDRGCLSKPYICNLNSPCSIDSCLPNGQCQHINKDCT